MENTNNEEFEIAIIGMGYVGLPLFLEFSKVYKTIGFDIDRKKIDKLKEEYNTSNMTYCSDDLLHSNFYIIVVPTPIDSNNKPDLSCLLSATETVAKILKKGDIVVYESTVYPGVTEELCIPILERISKLTVKKDFQIGYSPERINCNDNIHTIRNTVKIVSSNCDEALDIISSVYQNIIDVPVYKAGCIKEAEAAKIIENCQRDINIAFLNEISILLQSIQISSVNVLKACKTKWNSLDFCPGLVGGHCIGVDSYYLIEKAQKIGVDLSLLKSARNINENMINLIESVINKFIQINNILTPKITFLGFSFRENIGDVRNSKVLDLVKVLNHYNYEIEVLDCCVEEEIAMSLIPYNYVKELSDNNDIIVLAVPHDEYRKISLEDLKLKYRNKENAILLDVKNVFDREKAIELGYTYWSL